MRYNLNVKLFEKKALNKIFCPNIEEVTGGWRKLLTFVVRARDRAFTLTALAQLTRLT
jgi:hypothetical protein